MKLKFVQIRLERNRSTKTKIINLSSSFVGHLAEIILAEIDQAECMAAMSDTRIINTPEIDVLALGSGNHGVQIRIKRSPWPPEEIDSGRDEQERPASAWRGP